MVSDRRFALLHIGGSKCGSSALQEFLSFNPILSSRFGRLHYLSLNKNGRLLRGKALTQTAKLNVSGHVKTATALQLADLAAGDLIDHQTLEETKDPILLSEEGWSAYASTFQDSGLLKTLGLECEALFYVRPQPEVINAAWWQWGAWYRRPFEPWLEDWTERLNWERRASEWALLDRVAHLHVRLSRGDVVRDFCDFIGHERTTRETVVSNRSLPGVIVRLYQARPALRPSAHRPEIDFALSRHLPKSAVKAPWILTRPQVSKILEVHRTSNEALLTRLPASQQAAMLEDQRWWTADAYPENAADPEHEDLDIDDLMDAAADMAAAIQKLDHENRKLMHRMSQAKPAKTAENTGAAIERAAPITSAKQAH